MLYKNKYVIQQTPKFQMKFKLESFQVTSGQSRLHPAFCRQQAPCLLPVSQAPSQAEQTASASGRFPNPWPLQ